MTVAGPISSMTFIRDSTVLACAIGNKIFFYKVKNNFISQKILEMFSLA
jgi:hypothetical protein